MHQDQLQQQPNQLNLAPPPQESPIQLSPIEIEHLRRLEYARRIQELQTQAIEPVALPQLQLNQKKSSLFDDPIAVIMVGVGVSMLAGLGLFTIIANSLPNPQTQATTREWAAVAKEIAKSKDRPNVVCISWDCGKLAQAQPSTSRDRDWVGYWQEELPSMTPREVKRFSQVCQSSQSESCEAFLVVYQEGFK